MKKYALRLKDEFRHLHGGRWRTRHIREERTMWTEGAAVVGIPVRWRTEDRKQLRKKYKPGQKLMIARTEIEPASPGQKRKKVINTKEYKVIDTYEHNVLCKNEKGTRECFKYFELEQIAVQQERP